MAPLIWTSRLLSEATVLEFRVAGPNGLLIPAALRAISFPPEVCGREPLGLIFSGQGPIWLYAHLVHLAHPFAWVAVHDPRLGGAVVVMRHTPDAPELGCVVTLNNQPK